MPIKNQAIFTVLSEMNPNEATKGAQIAALDALIRTSLDDPNNFRAVVLQHKEVLGAASEDLFKYDDAEAEAGESRDVENNDAFLSVEGNEDGQYSLQALKEQAALKRIQFGLKVLADTQLASLKELLTTETELRAWFKTKTDVFSDYDWGAEPYLLTDESIEAIKEKAKLLGKQKITDKINLAIDSINQLQLKIQEALGEDLTAARLKSVIADYTSLKDKGTRLNTDKNENAIFLAEEEEDILSPRLETVFEQFNEITAQLEDVVTTYIDSQYEVFEQEDPAGDNATNTELDAQLNTLKTRFASVEQALILAEMVKDEEDEAAALVELRQKKMAMERGLIALNFLTYNKLVLEKAAIIDANATEISQYNGTGSDRARLLGLSKEAFKTLKEQATASAEKATIAQDELYNELEDDRRRILELNDATQAALRIAETHLKFSELLTKLPNEPRHFGNTFIDHGREMFHTVVVKKGATPPVGDVSPTAGGLAVQVGHATTQPTYERVNLEPGDAIHSTIAFPRAPAGAAAAGKVTVKLIQDHKGIVTRHTDGQLNAEESLTAAIRQAELLLNNYESGDIILTGAAQNAPHAKILLAVLLVLKQNCPALAAAKIVSEVSGCDAPKPAATSRWNFLGKAETQATVNQSFIEANLPGRAANEPKIQRLAQQINQLTQVKAESKRAFSILKQEIQQARGANLDDTAQRIENVAFKEHEEVTLDGTRAPIAGR